MAFPVEIRSWLLNVFASANTAAAGNLSRVPNAHEPTIDTTLISALNQYAVPFRFPSDWVIRIDTHYLGSSRYWGRWEIADIGLLAMFRKGGKLLRTKVALLQSKKLYPDEVVTKDVPNYVGFGALYEPDNKYIESLMPRTFSFNENSKYKALEIGDEQYQQIENYENLSSIPVYYSLQNPLIVPSQIVLPTLVGSKIETDSQTGIRVIPADTFRRQIAPMVDGKTPSFSDLLKLKEGDFAREENRGGWRLEHFVVDLFLGCKEGYRIDDRRDTTLLNLFGGRTAPITAAVAVNIDAPANTSDDQLFNN